MQSRATGWDSTTLLTAATLHVAPSPALVPPLEGACKLPPPRAPRSNRHRARGTAVTPPPAISCLGASPTPAHGAWGRHLRLPASENLHRSGLWPLFGPCTAQSRTSHNRRTGVRRATVSRVLLVISAERAVGSADRYSSSPEIASSIVRPKRLCVSILTIATESMTSLHANSKIQMSRAVTPALSKVQPMCASTTRTSVFASSSIQLIVSVIVETHRSRGCGVGSPLSEI